MSSTAKTAAFAIAMWAVLCGCVLLNPGEEEEPTPPPSYEGCSDDHSAFLAATDDFVKVVVDSGVADDDCNELYFHAGGGGQGGDVFHVEPRLRVLGAGITLQIENVTWELYDMDGNVLNAQGFEVFEGDLVEIDGGVEHRAQMFIRPDQRGKNFRVRGATTLPTESGVPLQVAAEAAVYISGPVP